MSCKKKTTVYLVEYRYMQMVFDDPNTAFSAYQALSAGTFIDENRFGPDGKKAWFHEPAFKVTMQTIQADKIYESREHAEQAICPPDKPDNLDDDEAVAA